MAEPDCYTCYTCGYHGPECVPDDNGDDICAQCGTIRGDGFGDCENDPRDLCGRRAKREKAMG